MKPEAHGGDLRRMAAESGRDPGSILDFSVNIRPEGPPEYLRAALVRTMDALTAYPSPHAGEALEAAARHHRMDVSRFVFGNGSNELIHALARALRRRGIREARIIEPAFSEYAIACRLAGITPISVQEGVEAAGNEKLLHDLAAAPSATATGTAGSCAVFLANPGNPSGLFRSPGACRGLMDARPDLLWVLDEAFIEYAGPEASILPDLPENGVVLRSLTKFHAVPGVRLGYLAASGVLARAVQAELPAWNVNAFALAAAQAALADTPETAAFARLTRETNDARRRDLAGALSGLPGVTVFPSAANYVLFRCPGVPDLSARLLSEYGIAVRDCSNYAGLEDGSWLRAAVRFPEDHRRLADALRLLLEPQAVSCPRKRPTPALMLQGTSSNAGKSLLAAAFCRIFRQDGHDVAPFKAQNMSLNSGVTGAGDEMGRAQIVQALAARVEPEARMNPILLKPHSDTGSQVVLLGKPIGHMSVRDYFARKPGLWRTVAEAYDGLAGEHELMVLEGAGSPGEINLKFHDLVNMRMAAHAGASVLLVGDIDRGGVYASFLGTWMTFTSAERRLLAGYIVNRFRGDASLLGPAHDYLTAHTGVPVLGTVPYIRDPGIPEEDMAGFPWGQQAAPQPGMLDIAVVMPGHVSNYTDFAPLAAEPDICLRPVRRIEDWGTPDVVILPGSKSVAADLEALRRSGLAGRILEHAARDRWIVGICGGLQMLGMTISDPCGIESPEQEIPGLGLMDLRTSFGRDKTLIRVQHAETPLGPSGGYEIHHGHTEHGPSARPLFVRQDGGHTGTDPVCGYVCGRRWATYLHGLFDDDAFRRAWIDHVREDIGLPPQHRQLATWDLDRNLDRLADTVREHVDMATIYHRLGLK